MKKLLLLCCLLVSVIGITGCGQSSSEAKTEASAAQQADSNQTSQTAQASSKTLVVYYSASGYTERIAQIIGEQVGADVIGMEPVDPYTDADLNYRNESSRVVREHDDPALQDVKLKNAVLPNWQQYDTVYVGYPIWWHDAAWPIFDFIKSNDFTGKTVIPFATSYSSPLENSDKTLANMAGTGNWLPGKRFDSHASEDEVKAWLAELK